MPINLEIKSKYASAPQARRVARNLGARYKGVLRQTDTYFDVRRGRLKLREINDAGAELIFYLRENTKRSRYSDYIVLTLTNKRAAMQLLKSLFDTTVVVRKKRELFLYKNSRIHIDSVNRLGSFVEIEVIVRRGKMQAQSLMSFLRKEFNIVDSSLIGGSYSDMMKR
jgi:predicted adenylyl cyclase CyaB